MAVQLTKPAPSLHEDLKCAAVDTESLRSHFSDLDGVPSDRIFFIRKVQQLGLDSADAVQDHFSYYGIVENVLVAHSPVLSKCKTYVRRFRPSNLAIVVMTSAAMAEAVHDEGVEQSVRGVVVHVERYERRGEGLGGAAADFGLAKCGAVSSGKASLDGETTHDGGSSGTSECQSEYESEEACISGEFEYWATDDEGF